MKKFRTNSLYYDYQLNSSPYQNTPKVMDVRRPPMVRRHGKQVFTAEEKKNPLLSIQHKEKSRSFENLSKKIRKDVKSAGDFNDASKEISEYENLNSKACQTIWQTKTSEHDGCNYLISRRSSGNQRLLRYLLKLSNNTFYATLQHEIDVLKKEKKALEDESTLHSQTILKILRNQSDEKRVLMTLIDQNQKLEHVIQRKEPLLDALSEDIRELKSNQPIFLTYVNHEAISEDKADKTMVIDTKKSKSQQKSSKSYPAVSSHISKPSNSKIQSISAPIISRPDEVQQLSKISMDLELNYQLPISNSDIFTDTEILNKNALFQKNVATNSSINDCPSSLWSESSTKRIKSRTWTKYLCCR